MFLLRYLDVRKQERHLVIEVYLNRDITDTVLGVTMLIVFKRRCAIFPRRSPQCDLQVLHVWVGLSGIWCHSTARSNTASKRS